MVVHVASVCTRNGPWTKLWTSSLKKNNFEHITLLASGEKWQGFAWRTVKYITFVKQLIKVYGANALVLLSDGEDVYFVQSSNILEEKFIELGQEVVVAAESFQMVGRFSHHRDRALLMEIAEQRMPGARYKGVNAGLMMGYAYALLELLELNQHKEDDQEGLQMLWLENPDRMFIDFECRLFGVVRMDLSGSDRIGRVLKGDMPQDWDYNSKTKCLIFQHSMAEPCVLHFAGKCSYVYNTFLSKHLNTNINYISCIGRCSDFLSWVPWYGDFVVHNYRYLILSVMASFSLGWIVGAT